MSVMASHITGVSIVYSNVCSGANQRKHQSSASLVFVRRIHRWPVYSLHKGRVTRKIFPIDDVIMETRTRLCCKVITTAAGSPLHNTVKRQSQHAWIITSITKYGMKWLIFARTNFWTYSRVAGERRPLDAHMTSHNTPAWIQARIYVRISLNASDIELLLQICIRLERSFARYSQEFYIIYTPALSSCNVTWAHYLVQGDVTAWERVLRHLLLWDESTGKRHVVVKWDKLCGSSLLSLLLPWTNSWRGSRVSGDLKRHDVHATSL